MNRTAAGREGEERAVDFLIEKKYRILRRNYRAGRGEVDIVAEEQGMLVFVEVKLRRSSSFGDPEDAVTPLKQRAIRSAARSYLSLEGCEGRACRFDVIAIDASGAEPVIRHLEDAF